MKNRLQGFWIQGLVLSVALPMIASAQIPRTQSPQSHTLFGSADPIQSGEAYINNLYIPANGYDDNDNIEFLIDGVLPNPCYGISANPFLEASIGGNFTVHQPIYRKTEGPCVGPDSALKGIYASQVPFDPTVVKLGVLQKGDYKIFYLTSNGYQSRNFNVSAAPTDSIDSMNYAHIENAYIPTRTFAGTPVRIVIQAALINSCQRATKDFHIAPDNAGGDIVVILPEVDVSKSDLCVPTYEPFEQIVEVPNLKAGRYHLLVRSFNGSSVNRLFNVY